MYMYNIYTRTRSRSPPNVQHFTSSIKVSLLPAQPYANVEEVDATAEYKLGVAGAQPLTSAVDSKWLEARSNFRAPCSASLAPKLCASTWFHR